MNQPTPITVTNYIGRPANPFSYNSQVEFDRENGTWNPYDDFEATVTEHPCPAIANTEPGKTVIAYQVMQERNPNATNAFDWQDCVIDGYDPICKTGWEQRIIWRPVFVPIVEQKEGESHNRELNRLIEMVKSGGYDNEAEIIAVLEKNKK